MSILQDILSKYQPFKIHFKKLNFFEHSRTSFTVWLDPASPELIELQNDIFKSFPDCHDLNFDSSRNIDKFVPHLAIGQWSSRKDTLEVISNFEDTFDFEVTLNQLTLISRPDFETPFQIHHTIKLGQIDTRSNEVIEYVTSISNDKIRESGYPSYYYGLGEEKNIWYFAYGANMDPGKLNRRQIRPLESLPAILHDYRLCFNVGGAMGNIQEITSNTTDASSDDDNPYEAPNEVHGVIHKLNCFEFSKLTNMEQSYLPTEVIVKLYADNSEIRAVAFICPPERCIWNGYRPTLRYLKLLRDGSKYWNLNVDYVKWLDGIESINPSDRTNEYWMGVKGKRIDFRNRRVGVRNARQVGNYKGKVLR